MKRWIPLSVILALIVLFHLFGFYKILGYETLRYHHVEMTEYVQNNPVLAPIFFIGICTFAHVFTLPIAIFVSLLGGFLFPQPFCSLYVVIGATFGSTLPFLAARMAIGDFLDKRASSFIHKVEAGFQKNAASYLLFFRFVPFFPFWVVNLTSATFRVSLWTFLWTTSIGIIPATFITTQAGKGLGTLFESEGGFALDLIFNLQVKIGLICLGIFSLVPIIVKKYRKKKNDELQV